MNNTQAVLTRNSGEQIKKTKQLWEEFCNTDMCSPTEVDYKGRSTELSGCKWVVMSSQKKALIALPM